MELTQPPAVRRLDREQRCANRRAEAACDDLAERGEAERRLVAMERDDLRPVPAERLRRRYCFEVAGEALAVAAVARRADQQPGLIEEREQLAGVARVDSLL